MEKTPSRKPLVLLGARQVGKTWLMREFGENEYDNVAYVNCDTDPLVKGLFLPDYDINRLLLGLQGITNQPIKEGKTLIILDEIQEAPRALHSLKYFYENAPGYHVMVAGSLLGVTIANSESFPVGKVDTLHIYPMDFDEFLQATAPGLVEIARDYSGSLAPTFAEKLIDRLRQYYFVGGLPEVVKAFANSHDLDEVRKLQSKILDAYRRDISHHAKKTVSVRIGQVLSSLPSQLARENKRFIYGAAKKGGRAADFELAIQWLIDAGLVYKVPRVSRVQMPLKLFESIDAFKLFFLDVGLLCCMADAPWSIIVEGGIETSAFSGMIAEQYVAQQLQSAGYALYYWTNEKTPAEIDFVLQRRDIVLPIEVKSGKNVRGKSIAQLVKDNPALCGIRFSLLPYQRQDWLTNIPLYAAQPLANDKHFCDSGAIF